MDKNLIEVITTWIPSSVIDMDGVKSITKIDKSNVHLIENAKSREEVEMYFANDYGDKVYRIVGVGL